MCRHNHDKDINKTTGAVTRNTTPETGDANAEALISQIVPLLALLLHATPGWPALLAAAIRQAGATYQERHEIANAIAPRGELAPGEPPDGEFF